MDFNNRQKSRRRRILEEWADALGLELAFSNGATTFRRSRGEKVVTSSLDLIFASPNTEWHPGPYHLEFTGSDLCILSGQITKTNEDLTQIMVIDWA